MSKQILCSTGALIGRPNNRDYHLLEELSKQLQCDGFEFMMYGSWYEEVEELIAYLQKMNFNIPVVHCEKQIGRGISRNEPGDKEESIRLFTINCDLAQKIGAKKVVLHLWDGVPSDSQFENNLTAYEELYAIAQSYDLELLVENVVCNHLDPMTRWVELAQKYPYISFVYDTKMAAFHEQIDLIYEEEYQWLWNNGHIRHLHVNDYAGGYMEWSKLKTEPIGKGHVDFEKLFHFIAEKQYTGDFTVEATAFDETGSVDTQMLNENFAYIREHI